MNNILDIDILQDDRKELEGKIKTAMKEFQSKYPQFNVEVKSNNVIAPSWMIDPVTYCSITLTLKP